VFPAGNKERVELRKKWDDECVRIGKVGNSWRYVLLPRFFPLDGRIVYPAPSPSRVEGDHAKQVRSSTFMFAL
jgi:hypothetical protein